MYKFRKYKGILLVTALVFPVFVATPAKADPISGTILAIAGWVSGAAGAAGATAAITTAAFYATTAALYAVTNIGLSYVAKAIAGDSNPGLNGGGVRATLESGDGRPRSFIIGEGCTAGSVVYANTWTYPGQETKPNEFLTMVIALSDIPVTGFTGIFVGDVAATYNPSGHTTAYIPGVSIPEFEFGSDYYMWVKFYDGTQTTADPTLLARFGTDPNYPYLSTMIGTGIAYVIITLRRAQSLFPSIPQTKFQIRGASLYEQRSDPGGGGSLHSGSVRFNDRSTWYYWWNPIGVIHNILRGISAPSGYKNLILQSQDFTAGYWSWTAAAIDTVRYFGPDGNQEACKLYESSTNANHAIFQTPSNVADFTFHVLSCFFKAGERTSAALYFENKGGFVTVVYINLVDGSFTTQNLGVDQVVVEYWGDGWWRVAMHVDSNTGSSMDVRIYPVVGGLDSYMGSAGAGIYIYGCQLEVASEAGCVMSPYAKTTTTASTIWKPFYGLQNLPRQRTPQDSLLSAESECAVDVLDIDGNTVEQYITGVELMADVKPADAIDEFLKACNGRMTESGGYYKFNVGASSSSVYSFTDDDVIISQEQTTDQFPSQSEVINAVFAKYPEPSESWNLKDAPARFNSLFETQDDNNRLPVNLTFSAVPSADQVQRLMASALLESRKFRKHTLTLPPYALILEPGDIVSWTSTRNGYVAKDFRVEQMTVNYDLSILVLLLECDPADYDFDTSTDYLTPTITPVVALEPVDLPAVSNLLGIQLGSAASLSWTPLPAIIAPSYDISEGGVFLAQDVKNNTFITPPLSAGDHTFSVQARDKWDNPPPTAPRAPAANVTVTVGSVGGSGGTGFAPQTYTYDFGSGSQAVPTGATSLTIRVYGPGGGNGYSYGGLSSGGAGGGYTDRTIVLSGDEGKLLDWVVGGPGDAGYYDSDIGPVDGTTGGTTTVANFDLTNWTGVLAAYGGNGGYTGSTASSSPGIATGGTADTTGQAGTSSIGGANLGPGGGASASGGNNGNAPGGGAGPGTPYTHAASGRVVFEFT